ncbi:MAG: zinc ABC transporter substrate-binding protein [Verrucomicrobia bacterium]|nr:zinc ABC transporter substrate-binding protein [Verrucomicrobiota bacterium]
MSEVERRSPPATEKEYRVRYAIVATTVFSTIALAWAAEARVKVVVSYPYIESLVKEVAGGEAEVTVLAKAGEDPHVVVPRPSFIGKLRQADLFIMNGASLEIGFVPPLLQQANNPKVSPGGRGFVDLSQSVDLMGKPAKVDRSEGDVHPEGNPHFVLDWRNVPKLAKAIAAALASADPSKKEDYERRLHAFEAKWRDRSAVWEKDAARLHGRAAIQYHRLFNYFFARTGIAVAAEVEPKPGIPPTGRHVEEIIETTRDQKIIAVFTDTYHDRKTAEGVAKKLGVACVTLPHDAGAVDGSGDIFALFETLLKRLPND